MGVLNPTARLKARARSVPGRDGVGRLVFFFRAMGSGFQLIIDEWVRNEPEVKTAKVPPRAFVVMPVTMGGRNVEAQIWGETIFFSATASKWRNTLS